jgi:hypothetical protein
MHVTLALRFFPVFVFLASPAILAQNRNTPSQNSLPKDYSFIVEGNRSWTDTGLDLEAGDRIHVYGAVIACEGPSPTEKEHVPLPSAPGGALLLKIHLDGPPILAFPDADLPIVIPSHLWLGVNGWNCHGNVPARVHVEWHKPSR